MSHENQGRGSRKAEATDWYRLLPGVLSLLLLALAVQGTSLLTTAERWFIIFLFFILAAIVAFLMTLEKINTKHSQKMVGPDIPVTFIVESIATHKTGARVLALCLSLMAIVSYHAWHGAEYPPSPGGKFFHPVGSSRGTSLEGPFGKYIFRLNDVSNLSSDLVWLELAAPQYSVGYAQAYQYYYTQASGQLAPRGVYSAILEIDNYGPSVEADIVTAFACSATDTRIAAGNDQPTIRKQAGCHRLDQVCVLVPKCNPKQKVCVPAPKKPFNGPSKCDGFSTLKATMVAPVKPAKQPGS
jgi:hypothetical protein